MAGLRHSQQQQQTMHSSSKQSQQRSQTHCNVPQLMAAIILPLASPDPSKTQSIVGTVLSMWYRFLYDPLNVQVAPLQEVTHLSHEFHHAGREDEDCGEHHENRALPVVQPVRNRVTVELCRAQEDLAALHDAPNDAPQKQYHNADLHEELHAHIGVGLSKRLHR